MGKLVPRAIVEVRDVTFAFGELPVLSGLELSVSDGEIVALVGPSGCGKSTLLRLVAGLEVAEAGEVNVRSGGTGAGGLRLLFQDYDAFPWLTVEENVRRGSGPDPCPEDEEVWRQIERVGLGQDRCRYPAELSGGMRKRLALARCLVRRPRLLLMDEAFGSLDVDTRFEMYSLVQELTRISGTSVMMVTHDLGEAVLLADRVLIGSGRPMSIRGEVSVGLPRPRSASMMNDVRFVTALNEVHAMLTGHAVEVDLEELARLKDMCRRSDHLTDLPAFRVLRLVGERRNQLMQVRMGGRSEALAELSLLLWRAGENPEHRAALAWDVRSLAAQALQVVPDPSFGQPEWAVVLLGVVIARWAERREVWSSDAERAGFLGHARLVVGYHASEQASLPLPVRAACGSLLKEWEARFPDGLAPVVNAALNVWPDTGPVRHISDPELERHMERLSRRLPGSADEDERRLYRLYLERQGAWAAFLDLARLLT